MRTIRVARNAGDYRGLRVRVELSMHQARAEVAPFTLLDVEEELDAQRKAGSQSFHSRPLDSDPAAA